jgi:acyl-CoA synthetase
MTLAYAAAATDPQLSRSYRAGGQHTDVQLGALLLRNRLELGSRAAVLEGAVTLDWRELADAAAAFAGFLIANRIGPGDVVMWQLPNWWEAIVVGIGTWAAGAISNPVVPIYREHELHGFLTALRPACVVTTGLFRSCDHVDVFESSIRSSGWEPPVRVTVRASAPGWTALDDALRATPVVRSDVDPDAPALIVLTSGTTSGSKAVVHSTRTCLAPAIAAGRVQSKTSADRVYSAAPVSHVGGVVSSLLNPLVHGSSVLLRDRWEPQLALEDICDRGVTGMGGGVVFARELMEAMRAKGVGRLPLRNGFLCGSTSIPEVVLEELDAIGANPARSYGMSECPFVSGGYTADPPSVRFATDGRLYPGVEVRAVDEDGADVGFGTPGELLVRGPQRGLGYVDPAHTADGFDGDGWFRSGDMGVLTVEGTVTITGRLKDIINRGGEKLSAREIEDVLARHPGVLEVAVIPLPDPRLGEQPAAVVQLKDDADATPEELAQFLQRQGLARPKIPRTWHYVDELPRTPSGKVKKFLLIEQYTPDRD